MQLQSLRKFEEHTTTFVPFSALQGIYYALTRWKYNRSFEFVSMYSIDNNIRVLCTFCGGGNIILARKAPCQIWKKHLELYNGTLKLVENAHQKATPAMHVGGTPLAKQQKIGFDGSANPKPMSSLAVD